MSDRNVESHTEDIPAERKPKNGVHGGVKISRDDILRAYEMLHANMEPCFQVFVLPSNRGFGV